MWGGGGGGGRWVGGGGPWSAARRPREVVAVYKYTPHLTAAALMPLSVYRAPRTAVAPLTHAPQRPRGRAGAGPGSCGAARSGTGETDREHSEGGEGERRQIYSLRVLTRRRRRHPTHCDFLPPGWLRCRPEARIEQALEQRARRAIAAAACSPAARVRPAPAGAGAAIAAPGTRHGSMSPREKPPDRPNGSWIVGKGERTE